MGVDITGQTGQHQCVCFTASVNSMSLGAYKLLRFSKNKYPSTAYTYETGVT